MNLLLEALCALLNLRASRRIRDVLIEHYRTSSFGTRYLRKCASSRVDVLVCRVSLRVSIDSVSLPLYRHLGLGFLITLRGHLREASILHIVPNGTERSQLSMCVSLTQNPPLALLFLMHEEILNQLLAWHGLSGG